MKKCMEEATKRFIRLDHYFEKLRVVSRHIEIRKLFDIPIKGYETVAEMLCWQIRLYTNREKTKEWETVLKNTAKSIGLPENYISNLEIFLLLAFNGAYPIKQEELSRTRREDKYLRSKKLLELNSSINSSTGKKKTAAEVADEYDPLAQLADREKYIQFGKKKMLMYEFDDNNSVEKLWPVKEHNQWLDRYGLFTGDQVRKIISRHKKRYS